jgi:hypothetical protein
LAKVCYQDVGVSSNPSSGTGDMAASNPDRSFWLK